MHERKTNIYADMAWLPVMVAALYFARLHNYLLFHSFAEIFSIVVACSIFVVGWNSRRFQDNNFLLFLGVAFLFAGFIDLLHTLGYKGMNILPEKGGDLATRMWIAARYLTAVSLMVAPFFIRRKLRAEYILLIYVSVTALLLASIFLWNIFPVCFAPGVGLTKFKVISEYIICAILATSIFVFAANRKEFEPGVFLLLTASIVVTIFSELAFTLYTDVYGTANMIGHMLKIVAVYLIYKAIVVVGLTRPYDLLFMNLRESEKKHRVLVENLNEGIWVIDAESNTTFANDSMANMLGYEPEEMMGKHLFSFMDERGIELAKQNLERRRSGISEYHEFEFIRKDGERIYTHMATSPITDDAGNYTGAMAGVMDISEIKRMEHALRDAKETAELANRAKTEFLANMSHELRTPLNAVIGFSEFMLKGAPDELSEQQRDYVDKIFTSGQHLLALINDILDLSKIEAGKMELSPEEVDLPNILEYCLVMVREKAMNHGIRLELDAVAAPKKINADLRKLKQILFNLLSNAVKFTPDGGRVALKAREENGFANISVSDNGPGIAKNDLERIFRPFERAGVSGNIEGTGLGLSMVRRLVELHGGTVRAESEPGRGSVFHFTIPVNAGDSDKESS